MRALVLCGEEEESGKIARMLGGAMSVDSATTPKEALALTRRRKYSLYIIDIEAGGIELWLEELYLRPQARGRGAGSEFFTFLRGYGETIGARRLRLEVEEENTGARRLYRRMGFASLDYLQMIREDAQ